MGLYCMKEAGIMTPEQSTELLMVYGKYSVDLNLEDLEAALAHESTERPAASPRADRCTSTSGYSSEQTIRSHRLSSQSWSPDGSQSIHHLSLLPWLGLVQRVDLGLERFWVRSGL